MPNADNGGRELSSMVQAFVGLHPNARAYTSLGQLRYLSCLQHMDAVVGNSSSGLTEAPSMGIGTINIGNRQKGRLLASSVLNCEPNREDIREALTRLYQPEFQSIVANTVNPYGDGGASKKITEVLRFHSLDNLLKKSFFDIVAVPSNATEKVT